MADDLPENLEGADLRGFDLSERSFDGAILRKADLRGANLSGASFVGADLSECVLGYANLSSANLTGASLRHADLHRAVLTGTTLSQATLDYADLSRVIMERAIGTEASFRFVDFSRANLSMSELSRSTFAGASLRSANLTGARLENCAFSAEPGDWVDETHDEWMERLHSRANLDYACFERADLTDAVLELTFCYHTSFRKASLVRVNLYGARLHMVDFKWSNLAGLYAPSTDFNFCRLDDADVTGAKLRFSRFNEGTLARTNCSNASLGGAKFSNTKCQRTNFSNADLFGATFSVAHVESATFIGAQLTGTEEIDAELLRKRQITQQQFDEAKAETRRQFLLSHEDGFLGEDEDEEDFYCVVGGPRNEDEVENDDWMRSNTDRFLEEDDYEDESYDEDEDGE